MREPPSRRPEFGGGVTSRAPPRDQPWSGPQIPPERVPARLPSNLTIMSRECRFLGPCEKAHARFAPMLTSPGRSQPGDAASPPGRKRSLRRRRCPKPRTNHEKSVKAEFTVNGRLPDIRRDRHQWSDPSCPSSPRRFCIPRLSSKSQTSATPTSPKSFSFPTPPPSRPSRGEVGEAVCRLEGGLPSTINENTYFLDNF